MLEVGLGCALASIGGGILTRGLVSRWGEFYPRWMFWRAGRRMPPMLAVVPAAVVAVVLVPAGLMNLRLPTTADTWAVSAPGVLWTVWGWRSAPPHSPTICAVGPLCRRCGRGRLDPGEHKT